MSRTDARSDSLRRRPVRVIPAVLVSLALLAIGVGLVWAAVLTLRDGFWPSPFGRGHRWLAALSWGSATAVAISIAIAVLGLVLLICALKAGQPNALKLNPPQPATDIGETDYVMTRRSVARLASAQAGILDGVDSASATVRSRKVRVAVRTPSARSGDIAQQVNGRVGAALQAAGLARVPSVSTDVHTQKP